MVQRIKAGFSLIELLVVIFIISLLMTIGLTASRLVRLQGQDLLCKSNLRQMGLIQTTYNNDNEHLFPNPKYLYYSENLQTQMIEDKQHLGCIWHDKAYALDGPMMTQNTSAQGLLFPYLGGKSIQICKVNALASQERGCPNLHDPNHRDFTPPIPVDPAYSYTMNLMLYRRIHTAQAENDVNTDIYIPLVGRTLREIDIRKPSRVTRSPSQVFVFGEQNAWKTSYSYSSLSFPDFDMGCTYELATAASVRVGNQSKATAVGTKMHLRSASFATCHRAKDDQFATGYSFVVMLDGHVKKVTRQDQKRASSLEPGEEPSQYGPGGNVALAWPLETPPIAGWESQ